VPSPIAWPATLAGTPAVAVIEQAIARDRLSHSLLLQGDDLPTLEAVALAIADRLLHRAGAGRDFRPAESSGGHPDLFPLRPAGKMRQISADATRALIGKVQVTSAVAGHKVAIIHEADRMNTAAANIFLKTLEEPPAHTTLLLLTARPYALLPTIRSRVLHFRFPSAAAPVAAEGWAPWLADYDAWLGRVSKPSAERTAVSDYVMSIYGLVARFGTILEAATQAAWEIEKARLPAELDDDEQEAVETGLAHGLRARLFAEIARATRAFALTRINGSDPEAARSESRALTSAIAKLEQDTALLRLNLNESAVLESFLLASLRIWSRR
jgi:DNA polymerase-3 subunit delta'